MNKITLSAYLGGLSHKRMASYVELKNYGWIDPADVIPDPNRAPRERDSFRIEELGTDIAARGQLEPIRVCWSPSDDRYIIVSGLRRWKAIVAAGITKVYCIFIEEYLSSREIALERLVDALHTEQPDQLEVAELISSVMDEHQWSVNQVAKAMKVSAPTISRYLSLVNLPAGVKDSVQQGQIAPSVAYEISKLAHTQDQVAIAEAVVEKSLTRNEVIGMIDSQGAPRKQKASDRKPAKKTHAAKRIYRAANGCTVTVTSRRRLSEEQIIEACQAMIDHVRRQNDAEDAA